MKGPGFLFIRINKNMFNALKKLFTKTIQLTCDVFQKAEITKEPTQSIDATFVSAEVINEYQPKIKQLKSERNSD